MDKTQKSSVKDPSSSQPSSTIDSRWEVENIKPFPSRRSMSEGKIADSREIVNTEDYDTEAIEKQLQAEMKAKNELKSEVIRLNSVISDLQRKLEACTIESERKGDWLRGVEESVTEERTRQAEVVAFYKDLYENKEKEIKSLMQKLETQRLSMAHRLEDHSRIGQDLAHSIENERREWQMEKDSIRSDFIGTCQLLHEQEEESKRYLRQAQEAEERVLQLERELEDLTLKHDALVTGKPEEESSSVVAADTQSKAEEIHYLTTRLTKVHELIEDNYQKYDADITELRNRLVDALDQRDKAVTELHTIREKNLANRPVTDPVFTSNTGGSSAGGNVLHLTEKCDRLEAQLEEVRFELQEEREISQATQANLEEQFRVNSQLDAENTNLKNNLDMVKPRASQGHHSDAEMLTYIQNNMEQIQDTLKSAQAQASGVIIKRKSSQSMHHASTLNISLQEAQHQVEAMIGFIEETLNASSKSDDMAKPSTSKEKASRTSKYSLDRGLRSLFRSGNSSTLGTSSKKNKGDTSQKLKIELEDLRKECVDLVKENFTLEQCVRYLSARCQLYQTICFAREGRHRRCATDRFLYSQTSKRPVPTKSRTGASTSEASGEIQIDPRPSLTGVGDTTRGIEMKTSIPPLEEKNESSLSSSSGKTQNYDVGSTALSRDIELKLLSKISTVCEPFSHLTDTSSLLLTGLHPSQTTPTIAG